MNNWKQLKKTKLYNSSKSKEKEQAILEHYFNKTYTGIYAENCKMSMQDSAQCWCNFSPPCPKWFSRAALTKHHKPWGWNYRNCLSSGCQKSEVKQGQLSAASRTCLASSRFQGCLLSWVLHGVSCSAFTPASVVIWFLLCVCASSLMGTLGTMDSRPALFH